MCSYLVLVLAPLNLLDKMGPRRVGLKFRFSNKLPPAMCPVKGTGIPWPITATVPFICRVIFIAEVTSAGTFQILPLEVAALRGDYLFTSRTADKCSLQAIDGIIIRACPIPGYTLSLAWDLGG